MSPFGFGPSLQLSAGTPRLWTLLWNVSVTCV